MNDENRAWFALFAKEHDKLAAYLRTVPGEEEAGKPTNAESVFDAAIRVLTGRTEEGTMIREDFKRQRYGPTTRDVLDILKAVRDANKESSHFRYILEDIFTRVYQEGIDAGLAAGELIREFPEARL